MSVVSDRWGTLKGGYKIPLDPRPLIKKLEGESDTEAVWRELWNELHHQGDVGDASYAAIPLLVDVHRKRAIADWNTYAIVSTIELARTEPANPEIPEWLSDDYFRAIQELSTIGTSEIAHVGDSESVRAILSVIALAKGLRVHAKFLINYSDDELRELEESAQT